MVVLDWLVMSTLNEVELFLKMRPKTVMKTIGKNSEKKMAVRLRKYILRDAIVRPRIAM